jgi:hypothetical protein
MPDISLEGAVAVAERLRAALAHDQASMQPTAPAAAPRD